MMKIKAISGKAAKHKTQALVVGLFKGERPGPDLKTIDKLINGEVGHLIKTSEFSGDKGEVKLIHTQRRAPAAKLLLVGLGDKKDFTTEGLRRAASKSARRLRDEGVTDFTTTLHQKVLRHTGYDGRAAVVTEGTVFGLYDFKKYITVGRDKFKKVDTATLLTDSAHMAATSLTATKAGIKRAETLAASVCFVRDLVNESAENVTPKHMAAEARKIARTSKGKVKVKVFGRRDVERMGMGGMEAVSRGSRYEPQFVVAEYKGGGARRAPAVFVGKGITFDSGGLNVKPSPGMEDMRSDMAGAATVLGTLKAAVELGIKRNVVIIMPLCENMIGPASYKQGDIIRAYNGKTIEIWPDAEGRLVLADGLSYAQKHYKDAEWIIDIATLTGAAVYATGTDFTPLISTDDNLKRRILEAGQGVDEPAWELPVSDDYRELVKAKVADVRNTANKSPGPGTITAALFLENFVEKTPWAHLDIAATSWAEDTRPYNVFGGTGVHVRTFIRLLEG